VRTRLIPLPAVTDADVHAWQRLADGAAEPNLYLDPRFLVPARHRGDDADGMRVLVVEEDGEWLAALCVATRRIGRRVPLRATTTAGEFMAVHADRHQPLVHAGRTAEALEALLRGGADVGLPGLVQLRRFPADGPLADALAEVAARTPVRVHEYRREPAAFAYRDAATDPAPAAPAAQVGEVPETGPPLATGHLSARGRKDLRRRARGLARDAGGPLELHDVSTDPAVDDEFVAIQAAGWKGDVDVGGDALALDPAAERWFRSVVAAFRADGDALVLRLCAGGSTQFLCYTLRSGGAYFGFLDTYAERHRKFSPGAIGRLAETAHVLGSTSAPFFDPAFGARYTEGALLYPHRREYVDLLVAAHGAAARAVVRGAPLAGRLGFLPG
jgi:hypothetical protein